MAFSNRWRFLTAGLMLAALGVAGCDLGGPRLYPAAGRVQFDDGTPVRNATIEFVPLAGGLSPRGRIDAEGRFELSSHSPGDGAPAGDYRVVVIQAISPRAGAALASLGEEHAGHAGSTKLVSPRHASPDTTGIDATLKPAPSSGLLVVVESR